MVDHNFFGQSPSAFLCNDDPKIAWHHANEDSILCCHCNFAAEIGVVIEEKCAVNVHDFVDNHMSVLDPDNQQLRWQKRHPELRICLKCNKSIAFGIKSTCEQFASATSNPTASSIAQSVLTARADRNAMMHQSNSSLKTPPPNQAEVALILYCFFFCYQIYVVVSY